MASFEAVLGGRGGEGSGEEGEEEAFKKFGERAEERNGAVGSGEVGRFVRFEDGEYVGFFPDRGDLGVGDGEVKGGGDEGDGARTEVFEVRVGHAIWTDRR